MTGTPNACLIDDPPTRTVLMEVPDECNVRKFKVFPRRARSAKLNFPSDSVADSTKFYQLMEASRLNSDDHVM